MSALATRTGGWRADLTAAVVVSLVSLPLSIGIAHAAGAPLLSGLIAAVVGGIIVGALSSSPLSVSGPAAGLIVPTLAAVEMTGAWDKVLIAVMLAGVMQLAAARIGLGVLSDFVPNAVIKGMLTAIGILIILKQAPHLVGYDADFEGDEALVQGATNTFTALLLAVKSITPSAAIVGAATLAVLLVMEVITKKRRVGSGPLVALVFGVALYDILAATGVILPLEREHLVDLPRLGEIAGSFTTPSLAAVFEPTVWSAAAVFFFVGSLESLLTVQAVERLDRANHFSSGDRELFAQGVGNLVSGFFGGMPLSAVIVRSSTAIAAGARTRRATIAQGVLIALYSLFFAGVLNRTPLAVLAAILIFAGLKLVSIERVRATLQSGRPHAITFVATVVAVLASDVLRGIGVGLLFGVFFVLTAKRRSAVLVVTDGPRHLVRLRRDVSFVSKALLRQTLAAIPEGSEVILDLTHTDFVDHDVVELLNDFTRRAPDAGIKVELKIDRERTATLRQLDGLELLHAQREVA